MRYREAVHADVPLLARLNRELILDEGHRNTMLLAELEARMAGFLASDYAAVIFEDEAAGPECARSEPAGYALFRRAPDHVYLRQFFVCRDRRRTGVGRRAIEWLRQNAWSDSRIRIDVLIGNDRAIAFWRSVGFDPYCLTMESDRSKG